MFARATLFLALAAFSSASLVARHELEDCTGSESGTTQACSQNTSRCCPSNWSCVVPADGTEVCMANSRGSSCPKGYGKQGNTCILGATSGSSSAGGVSSTAGSGASSGAGTAAPTEGSGAGTATSGAGSQTGVPAAAYTTTHIGVVETSETTSHSVTTSGSATVTIPVSYGVPVTREYEASYTVLPSSSGTYVIVDASSNSASTSWTTSGTETIPITVNVPVESKYTELIADGTTSTIVGGSSSGSLTFFPTYSTSGSVTVPVTGTATLTTSGNGSVGTAPPGGNAARIGSSIVAVAGAAAFALFAL